MTSVLSGGCFHLDRGGRVRESRFDRHQLAHHRRDSSMWSIVNSYFNIGAGGSSKASSSHAVFRILLFMRGRSEGLFHFQLNICILYSENV